MHLKREGYLFEEDSVNCLSLLSRWIH